MWKRQQGKNGSNGLGWAVEQLGAAGFAVGRDCLASSLGTTQFQKSSWQFSVVW